MRFLPSMGVKMNKNEILTILEDWNFWKKGLDTGVRRDFYLQKFTELASGKHILVVTGARRSGKSYLLRQFAEKLISQGTPKSNILMINFEDPRFVDLDTELLQKIYEVYLEVLRPQGQPYVFLDEIQEVKNWEKWVRTMHELDRAKIILSGSNAKLLSREFSTLLTGRHIDLTVSPLSFREFLHFKNLLVEDELDLVNKRIEIKALLNEYLEFGAFPEVVLGEGKKEILLAYFDDVLNKDLVRRYKVRKAEKLNALAKFYLTNVSAPITFNSMEKFLEVSASTVEKYSDYLSTAYLTFFLKRFSFKVKEQEKSPRKVYVVDPGLANAAGFRFSQNVGRLAENAVFLELERRKAVDPKMEIFYWKDARQREVDFVVKKGLELEQLIQVCWDPEEPQTKKRELRGLSNAADKLGVTKRLVITGDYEGEEESVKFVPLWKWLLVDKVY
jgi:predicted AAA+ superfamily ATPase